MPPRIHSPLKVENFNKRLWCLIKVLRYLLFITRAKSPLLQGWSAELIKLDNLLDKTVTKQAQQHCKQTGIRTNT